jgi:hypothetical protein
LVGAVGQYGGYTGFIFGTFQFAAILYALCIAAALAVFFAFIAAHIVIADLQTAAVFVSNAFLCAPVIPAHQIAAAVRILLTLNDAVVFTRTNLVIAALLICSALKPTTVVVLAYQTI